MNVDLKNKEYDVIVIGGGATGAGTARDCAKRGLKVMLIERPAETTVCYIVEPVMQ